MSSFAPSVKKTGAPRNTYSEQKPEEEQRILDQETAEGTQKYFEENPWLERIPASTNDYYIGTQNNKEGFFVYLYPKKSSQTPIEIQTENIKSEAIDFLKEISAPTDKIEWIVSPK